MPTALVLSPDQRRLAVQFDQRLQWFALAANDVAPSLLAEYPLEAGAGRLLISSSGWAHYLIDYANEWSYGRSLHLDSGETRSGGFVSKRGTLLQGANPDHLLLFGGGQIRELHFDDDGLTAAHGYTRSIAGCAGGWALGAADRYTDDCGHVYALPSADQNEPVTRIIEEGLWLRRYTPDEPYTRELERKIASLHEQRARHQLLVVEQALTIHCDDGATPDYCVPLVTLPRNRIDVELVDELPVGVVLHQGQSLALHARHAFTRGNGQVLILSQLPGNPGSWYLTRQ